MVITSIRRCFYQFSWECLESIDSIWAIQPSVYSNSVHLDSCSWVNSLTSFWLRPKWSDRPMVLPISYRIMGLALLWYAAIIVHFVDRKVIGSIDTHTHLSSDNKAKCCNRFNLRNRKIRKYVPRAKGEFSVDEIDFNWYINVDI